MSRPRRPGYLRLLPMRAPRRRVLVVDDHLPTGAMLQDLLGGAGCAVDVALGLPEAEALLAAGRYDLVLTDALRRSTTGLLQDRWSAVERVRAAAGGAPVVLMSAHRPGYFADWRARGLAALLPKPFTRAELLAAVRRHLAPAS